MPEAALVPCARIEADEVKEPNGANILIRPAVALAPAADAVRLPEPEIVLGADDWVKRLIGAAEPAVICVVIEL